MTSSGADYSINVQNITINNFGFQANTFPSQQNRSNRQSLPPSTYNDRRDSGFANRDCRRGNDIPQARNAAQNTSNTARNNRNSTMSYVQHDHGSLGCRLAGPLGVVNADVLLPPPLKDALISTSIEAGRAETITRTRKESTLTPHPKDAPSSGFSVTYRHETVIKARTETMQPPPPAQPERRSSKTIPESPSKHFLASKLTAWSKGTVGKISTLTTDLTSVLKHEIDTGLPILEKKMKKVLQKSRECAKTVMQGFKEEVDGALI